MRWVLALCAGTLLAACSTLPAVGEVYRVGAVSRGTAPHGAEFALLLFTPADGVAAGEDVALRAALSAALRDLGRTTLAPDWVDRNVAAGTATGALPGLLVVSGTLGSWQAETADPGRSWLRAEAGFRLEAGGRLLYAAEVRFEARLEPGKAAGLEPAQRLDALRAALAARLAESLVGALR